MAEFLLTDQATFPNGTEVDAYPLENWPSGNPDTTAAPVGTATDTQTMASGTLTFTGLDEGTSYVAYAEVNSQHRYVRFFVPVPEDIATDSELATHVADTTSVHGITDTSALATSATLATAKAALAGAYRTVRIQDGRLDAAGSFLYIFWDGTVNTWSGSVAQKTFYLDPADYAVAGLTTKYRLRASVLTNNVAPAVTLTFGLHAVTAVAGGAAAVTQTVTASAVSGSTVPFVTPAATSLNQANSSDFTPPAAGYYVLGVIPNGSMAASSSAAVSVQLQARNV